MYKTCIGRTKGEQFDGFIKASGNNPAIIDKRKVFYGFPLFMHGLLQQFLPVPPIYLDLPYLNRAIIQPKS